MALATFWIFSTEDKFLTQKGNRTTYRQVSSQVTALSELFRLVILFGGSSK
jgi:hypothetical protein